MYLTKEQREDGLLKAKDFIPVYAAAMPFILDLFAHADEADRRIDSLQESLSEATDCDELSDLLHKSNKALLKLEAENAKLREAIKQKDKALKSCKISIATQCEFMDRKTMLDLIDRALEEK